MAEIYPVVHLYVGEMVCLRNARGESIRGAMLGDAMTFVTRSAGETSWRRMCLCSEKQCRTSVGKNARAFRVLFQIWNKAIYKC